jgi:hypothetical protein
VAHQGCLCSRPSTQNVNYEDFIEMLEFLCCFGKNLVSKAIKMKKISHISQHMWPLRAFF